MQACPKPTNEPTSSGFVQECGYSTGLDPLVPICQGSCAMSNSSCIQLEDDDMGYCGCSYCNYDTIANKCNGKCSALGVDKCISRVPEPKSDADCECSSCESSVDVNGNVSCSGSCFISGLSCKVEDYFVGFRKDYDEDIPIYYQQCVCQE